MANKLSVYATGLSGENLKILETDGIDATKANIRVQLTSGDIPDSQAIPMTQANKDRVAVATQNIIDIIGAENIALFLPMWETVGTTAYDLLNRDLTFTINAATLGQSGPFGNCMSLDGTTSYLRQDPKTENTAAQTDYALNSATGKASTRMAAITSYVGFVRMNLKLAGSLPSATIRASIYSDNAGIPGSVIPNGTSDVLNCTDLTTAYAYRGFTFSIAPKLQRNQKYWLILEYVTTTGVDSSNYVVWQYDVGSAYGEARATFDGTTWTGQTGNHAFGLWTNHLALPGDFTVFSCAKNNSTTLGFRALFGTAIMAGPNETFYIRLTNGGTTDASFGSFGTGANIIPTNFRVFTSSFSQAASSSKGNWYIDGKFVVGASGTAGAAMALSAQPLIIGGTINAKGFITNYWNGLINSTIIATRQLTAAEIGKVTHHLLVLRKYGGVV